jgi:hypothetical protein
VRTEGGTGAFLRLAGTCPQPARNDLDRASYIAPPSSPILSYMYLVSLELKWDPYPEQKRM